MNEITRVKKYKKLIKNKRNEFLGSISHELRTPLTYLKGYTDIIGRKNISLEDRNKYIKIIQEETGHLTELIKNLFELRSEEHTSELQSRFDLVCRLLLEKKK